MKTPGRITGKSAGPGSATAISTVKFIHFI
jgi:hypothetical protein